MSTELQQITSRTNGAKSHGPITEEGKAASSQNRLDHGFNSRRVVLPGESQAEFDALLASYLDEHQPETPTERAFIENMAIIRWRQQRVWSLETAAMDNQMRHPRYPEGYADDEANDFPTRAYVAFHTLNKDSRSLELLNRYDTRFERQFRAALTAFLNLRATRRAEERAKAPAPDTLPARLEPAATSGSIRNPENPAQTHRPHLVPGTPNQPRTQPLNPHPGDSV